MTRRRCSVPACGCPARASCWRCPALIDSGVFEVAREVYGSIGPAFYGLRTTLVAVLLMALLRIKRPEALKEHLPDDLGRLLGLDRAPEVKTLRRKLSPARRSQARQRLRSGARPRVASLHAAAPSASSTSTGTCASTTASTLPKTHVARMRIWPCPRPPTTG